MQPKDIRQLPGTDFFPVTLVFPCGETEFKSTTAGVSGKLSLEKRTVQAVVTVHRLDKGSLPKGFFLAEVAGEDVIAPMEDDYVLEQAKTFREDIVADVGEDGYERLVRAFRDGSDVDSLVIAIDNVSSLSIHDRYVSDTAPGVFENSLILPEPLASIRSRLGVPNGAAMEVEYHGEGSHRHAFYKTFHKRVLGSRKACR